MKPLIIFLTLFFYSCAPNINGIERKAKRGSVYSCERAVHYYKFKPHSTPNNTFAIEKIMTFCKLGIAYDTCSNNNCESYKDIFYRELAKSILTKNSEKNYYYLHAAKLGDIESQLQMGYSYMHGTYTKINNDSAIYWIKKASDNNITNYYNTYIPYTHANELSSEATKTLGDIYYKGQITTLDISKALYYYKKACACKYESLDISACDSLISFYKKTENIEDSVDLKIYSELKQLHIKRMSNR